MAGKFKCGWNKYKKLTFNKIPPFKDLVIVGSEKGGVKRKKAGEAGEEGAKAEGVEGETETKKVKTEDEDILKCFGCKHVYR